MSFGVWAKRLLAMTAATGLVMNAAAAAVVAGWYLLQPPPLPLPLHPYRDVTQCASGPVELALLDADGDDHPDIAILCEEELLVASGLNGDTLWRQDLP